MFENKKFMGTYYSRIIASWIHAGGYDKFGFDKEFKEWLRSLKMYEDQAVIHSIENGKHVITDIDGKELVRKSMPEEIVHEIYELATCGKSEYEWNIREWMENRK